MMRLTPLDIRKQDFTRGMRGFNVEEVEAFLQMLSHQWQEMLDEKRHLDEKVSSLQGKLSHYEKVEEALQEALQTARESSRRAMENAEQKARLIVQEAEANAREIRQDAEQRRNEARGTLTQLGSRRQEIVVRLRAFLQSELELLSQFDEDLREGAPSAPWGEARKPAPTEKDAPPTGFDAPLSQTEGDDEPAAMPAGGERVDRESPVSPAEYAGPADIPELNVPVVAHEAEALASSPLAETGEAEATTPAPAAEASAAAEARSSPGWTLHSVISGSPSYTAGTEPDVDATEEQDEEENGDVAASSEEIEKIRRILKDLD